MYNCRKFYHKFSKKAIAYEFTINMRTLTATYILSTYILFKKLVVEKDLPYKFQHQFSLSLYQAKI